MAEKCIKDGFKYPFNEWTRLFNFWWVLIPILGWFAVVGYFKKIVEHMLKKDFKELPKFGSLIYNFKEGFFFFLIMLVPMIIIGIVSGMFSSIFSGSTLGRIVSLAISIFLDVFLALLVINYVKHKKYEDIFDVKKVWNIMSKDWNKTLMAVAKQFAVVILLILASIPVVTMVVTIPAMSFAGYYFLVDLYNKA